jgi:DNA-binding PadR family transcriptional regulator
MSTEAPIPPEIPLSESTFYILLSIAAQPKHGYAIMKEVRQLSQERVKLSTGTLYGAIKRLLEQGWIERIDDPQGVENGRIRKAYRLTRSGRRVLEAETRRMRALLSAVEMKLGGESL